MSDWPDATLVLDRIREGALVYELDGRLRGCNARALALLGLDDDQTDRLALAPGGHPIAPLPGLWPSVVQGARHVTVFRAADRSGTALELELCTQPMKLGDAEVVLVELRDITAYRKIEKALIDSKKQLESAVMVRTRELQAKLALIESQQQELIELSTPVIQVWDGVLVLPLIGAVDDARAAQVTTNVLASIARTASRHVILDLTGVPEFGVTAASALRRTIQAVKLLGASASLAGMSAAVAQSLAQHDGDWSRSVRMFADLQAALKAAVGDARPDTRRADGAATR